jgi:RNA polymerase sigma-70 factor (ECF subfamily)
MTTTDTDVRDRMDMERLMDGHDAALNDLMERHATSVFRFLVGMLGNEEDANDLTQETFMRVYRARSTFRPEHKFTTWLFTIAANLARNQFRWRSRHPNVSLESESELTGQSLRDALPSGSPDPSQAVASTEMAKAVRSAVQDLPEDLREAIVLCEWEEKSGSEAASILNTTPKAVESRLYRARKLLREELKRWL